MTQNKTKILKDGVSVAWNSPSRRLRTGILNMVTQNLV